MSKNPEILSPFHKVFNNSMNYPDSMVWSDVVEFSFTQWEDIEPSITRALDFIEKIKEYNKVTSSHSVIDKIEKLNKIIQPQLMKEIEIISKKLLKLNDDLEELRPKYEKFIVEKEFYDKEEEKIRIELKNNGSLDVDNPYSDENKEKLRKVLNNKYSDYKAFESEWELINKTHDDLTTQIRILNRNSKNITSYIQRIKKYFQIRHKN